MKIQSELSSRSVCVVCYREISRPECYETTRKVFQRIRERVHLSVDGSRSPIGRRAAIRPRRPINGSDETTVFSNHCSFVARVNSP